MLPWRSTRYTLSLCGCAREILFSYHKAGNGCADFALPSGCCKTELDCQAKKVTAEWAILDNSVPETRDCHSAIRNLRFSGGEIAGFHGLLISNLSAGGSQSTE